MIAFVPQAKNHISTDPYPSFASAYPSNNLFGIDVYLDI